MKKYVELNLQTLQALYNLKKCIKVLGNSLLPILLAILFESTLQSPLLFVFLIQATRDNLRTNGRMDPTVPLERGIPLVACGKSLQG